MRKLLLLMLGATIFFSAMAQEESEPLEEDAEQVEAAQNDEDEADEPIVDDEFYQDIDDEDFRPSEDIPADQSIPFPTDI
jgi:hypothetical protein